MGKQGPCVGGSPGRDRLQHRHCCSRFIGQHLVTGRVQLPGSLATVGSLWPRRKRDTDAGAVTVPATPSGSASIPSCPRPHPGALLALALFCALSTQLSRRPAWALLVALCLCILSSLQPMGPQSCLLADWAGLDSSSLRSPSNPPCPAHVSGPRPSDPRYLCPRHVCALDGGPPESKSQQDRGESFQMSSALKSFL